ncbi:hypothetical protein [Streptomyces sp. NBC_00212]|uniref:hypothetical protein n=1 Tax=Streptomyces sp. NBC_00212 TaxID=2975684 RepID=UPI00324A1AFC
MNDLEKAARDAVEAADNTEQLALIAAVLKVQQLTQHQAAPVAQRPLQAYPVGTYVTFGCLGLVALVVVAFVLVAILIGLSIALVVLAVGLVALTICVLVLRSMWADYQQSKG